MLQKQKSLVLYNIWNCQYSISLFQSIAVKWKIYRRCGLTLLTNTYLSDLDKKYSGCKAAHKINVPERKLGDRLKGYVELETTKSGHQLLCLTLRKKTDVSHQDNVLSWFWSHKSRSTIINLGSQFACHSERHEKDYPSTLSFSW